MSLELKSRTSDDAEAAPTQEQIARRSYQIWEREGRPEGRAVAHWCQAAAELQSELLRRRPAERRTGTRELCFWDLFG
ncbi:MAG: DUF2934 domain-containing protein [Alphaproteobacteria bacterium]|nr:DUF2934 domain-containing protein [Alphaproteobacteria bacterium]